MATSVLHLGLPAAFAVTVATAVAWLAACTVAGHARILPAWLPSRKLLHIGTGLLFMACWPLYPEGRPASRLLCASVPLLAAAYFAAVGVGLAQDPALVASHTRHGRRQELLAGPLSYGLVHAVLCALSWRHSPAGAAALAVLCAGDGMAEVVGRAVASPRIPWHLLRSGSRRAGSGKSGTITTGPTAASPPVTKTVAGTAACLLCGAVAAGAAVARFRSLGLFDARAPHPLLLSGAGLARGALLCGAVGAAAEALPLAEIDNISIAVAVWGAARLYWGF